VKQKQFKISLDEGLRNRLDAVSAASGRSVAEEIRGRLEQTLREDGPGRDPAIRHLADDLGALVDALLVSCAWKPTAPGAWRNDRRIHDAIMIAIAHWLEIRRPPDTSPSAAADDLFDPRTLGVAAATAFEQNKQKLYAAYVQAKKDYEASRQQLERARDKAKKDIAKELAKRGDDK
jgi:plasmid stability protein